MVCPSEEITYCVHVELPPAISPSGAGLPAISPKNLAGKIRTRICVAGSTSVCPAPIGYPPIDREIVPPGKNGNPSGGPGFFRLNTRGNPKLLPASDFLPPGSPGTFLHTMSWVLPVVASMCVGGEADVVLAAAKTHIGIISFPFVRLQSADGQRTDQKKHPPQLIPTAPFFKSP